MAALQWAGMARPRSKRPIPAWRRWLPAGVAVLVLTFAAGYSVGKYGVPPHQPALSSVSNGGRPANMNNFWETKRLIEEKYVGQVDPQALITSASKGLVAALGDPYSDYLTTDEAAQLDNTLSGTVDGVGVEVGVRAGQARVITPIPDSPASRAGIKAGDLILAVDRQPTQGQTIDQVANRIRGKRGTSVTLEVKSGTDAPRSITLVRETIKAPSVTLTYRDNVAVIELSRFGDDTKPAMDKVVTDIQAKHPRGIVLDLRSNPGGFLDGAVQVTSLFQKQGLVVKEHLRNQTETQSVSGNAPLADYPLVVLVDKGSASAAEITAGALRDNRHVKLVGEQTFGKGSVQELEPLSGGAVLKLTIAEWLTPDNTSISKQGLKPDVTVSSNNPDAQLTAALGLLPR